MFRIGMKVVCVSGPSRSHHWDAPASGRAGPKKGETYTIREVDFCEVANVQAVRLEEFVLPKLWMGREGAWEASRFRPIVEKKTDTGFSILEEILRRETIDDRAPERARKLSRAE